MRSARAGLLYFLLTFGAGFALGPIRLLVLVPRIGVRAAELIEMPVMLFISYLAARWVTRRLALPPAAGPRLAMGLIALALLVTCEFTFVLRLQGLTLQDYLAHRDPVSGTAYALSLAIVALLPLTVNRR
jgi:hypothetical protein